LSKKDCSSKHCPSFVRGAQKLIDKGIDTVACVAVNDIFVLAAWAKNQRADKVRIIMKISLFRKMKITIFLIFYKKIDFILS
jgi:peroxiredoxin